MKRYLEFINEKYEETPEFSITCFFDELQKNIKKWFSEEGSLGSSGAVLADIKRSNLIEIDKNLIFDFTVEDKYYQVYVIVSLKNVMENNKIEECYIKAKIYDNDGGLIKSCGEEVKTADLNEDKIVEILAKLTDTESKEYNDLSDTSMF